MKGKKLLMKRKQKGRRKEKKLEDEENNAEIQDQEVDYDDIDDLSDL